MAIQLKNKKILENNLLHYFFFSKIKLFNFEKFYFFRIKCETVFLNSTF